MLHTNNGAIHEKEIRKTFGFGKEKFSAKVRLDIKMPGVPKILSKSGQNDAELQALFVAFGLGIRVCILLKLACLRRLGVCP